MQPRNHHLSIDDNYGSTIRAKVVYLQPSNERTYKHEAVVHAEAFAIISYGTYKAVYEAPKQTIWGLFTLTSSKARRNGTGELLMKGTFVATCTPPGDGEGQPQNGR